MKRLFKALFISILLLVSVSLKAETWFNYKHLNTSDGLSQPGIICITSDSTDCVWIGTKFGLNAFKNNRFYNYIDTETDNTPINGTYISALHVDKKGRLWVNTEKGVSLYDRETDSFNLITTHSFTKVTEWDDKMIFGGSDGIFIYDERKNTFNEIKNAIHGIDLTNLIPLSKNDLLIVSRYDIPYIYSKSSDKMIPFIKWTGKGRKPIFLSAIKWKDRIYFSVYHKGLFCTDLHGETLHSYTEKNGLTSNLILDMMEYYDELWLATDGDGILTLNPYTEKVTPLAEKKEMAGHTLPTNSFTTLYLDNKDNIWAGSVKFGIIAIRETPIRSFHAAKYGSEYGLSGHAIQSMFEEKDCKTVWLGTDGEGVNKFDIPSGKFKHYPETKQFKISSLTEYDKDNLLLSVYGKGLFLFNKGTGHIKRFLLKDEETDEEEFMSGFTTLVHKVGDEIFFFGLGMHVYDKSAGQFVQYKSLDGLRTRALSIIYESDDICYAINKNGVFEISRQRKTIRRIYNDSASQNNAGDYYDGKIWLGTTMGLKTLNTKTCEADLVEGPILQRITRIQFDNIGRLWITADNKLFCYTAATGRYEIFDEGDGFFHNEINAMSTMDESRYMLMGGPEGLTVAPKDLSQNIVKQPKISLVEAVVNGERIKVRPGKKTKVKGHYSSFDIHIGLDHYDLFTQKLFKYEFIGKISGEFTTYYDVTPLPPLPAGKYKMMASYLQKDGSWNKPVEILSFRVMPPFYLNPLFLLGLFAFLGIVSWFIIDQMRARNREKLEQTLLKQKEIDNEQMIQFLVNVSHEIRTPLTLIHAPLKRLLEKSGEMDAKVSTSLKGIYKHVHNMVDLINMVLDINRINASGDALRKMPTEIEKWAADIIGEFKNEYEEKNINLVMNSDCENLRVWFDKWKCRIVLSNLLMNALKFSPSNSTVTVSIHKTSKDIVRVSVKDEGPGLDRNMQEKLFTRFAQGQLNEQGSGLGLAYSYKLISLHGGTMNAFNNDTKGSTFYFDLPLTDEHTAQPIEQVVQESISSNQTLREDGEIDLKKKTVLVVDDNTDLTDFLNETLSEIFKMVQIAANGKEALDFLRGPEVPDIVISDVMMPVMDGFDLCTELKNDINISHIPIILLTARTEGESALKAYKIGADAYIPKPFDNNFLITVAKNLLINREKARLKLSISTTSAGPVENTFASVDEQFIIKFNNLIQDNLESQNMDVEFLAQSLLMSRSSLYNKVKALTGLGVNEYVNKTKMKIAMEMVKTTDLPITEIAFRLGYSSHHYFSKCFKAYYEVTPSDVRKQIFDKQ
ncbi:MAG: response regulator [Bacteroidales bacterium]|nr:response regulator [Bacteroidales bacterium]